MQAGSRRDFPARSGLRDGDGAEPDFGYYAEWEFADRDAFKAAARSPEFNATGPDALAMGIPFKVVFAEIE